MAKKLVKNKVRLTLDGSGTLGQEQEYQEKVKRKDTWQFYLGFVGEIGFVIAIPIVLGVLIGSYIDKKYDWYPKSTLTGLFIGLVISMTNFVQTLMALVKRK